MQIHSMVMYSLQESPRELINTGRSVKLYMPTGLAYRDTVNYENFDLGGMGAGADALKGGGSVAKSIFDGGMQTPSPAFGGSSKQRHCYIIDSKTAYTR